MLSVVQPAAGVFNEILAALLNGQIVRSRTQSRNKVIPNVTKAPEETNQRQENTKLCDVANSGNVFLSASISEPIQELGSFLRSNKVEVDQILSTRSPKVHLKVDDKCFLLSMSKNGNFQIQRRGFRTKTYESKIQEKKDKSSPSIFSFFGITSDMKTAWLKSTKQESLKTILDSTELKGPEKAKVAFAEGYFAGAQRKASKFGFSSFLLTLSLVVGLVYFYFVYKEVRISLTSIGQISPEEVNVTFNDVKGIEEVKEEVIKIVDYLKDPSKYTRLGARLPKGILLVGLPGSGKTLLAKAIAGEAQVPFFRTSGSEFEEMLVGLGAKRVRDLFSTARSRAPCVIFIDEIDSIGSKRSYNAMHPYANQTINQLLTEMDGFLSSSGVIVLAATNRRDDLDPALLRPGRFDVEIQVPWPDLKGRIEIFNHYLSKIKKDADVNAESLAKSTVGFSGAEIENMINQAALKAASDNKASVDMHYLDMAHDFVRMGPARKALPSDRDTNLNTAYHEAGHALVAYFTKDSIPLHKVTIVPRGQTLGHTSYRPEKDSYGQSKSELLAAIDVAMGGRAAEELIFGAEKVTTGAMSDLSTATKIVEQMVRNCGMSDKAGFRFFRNDEGQVFNSFPLSPATAELLDNEIKRLLQESYERAKQILKVNAAAHKRLAEALLEYETLDAEEMKTVIEGRPLDKKIAIS